MKNAKPPTKGRTNLLTKAERNRPRNHVKSAHYRGTLRFYAGVRDTAQTAPSGVPFSGVVKTPEEGRPAYADSYGRLRLPAVRLTDKKGDTIPFDTSPIPPEGKTLWSGGGTNSWVGTNWHNTLRRECATAGQVTPVRLTVTGRNLLSILNDMERAFNGTWGMNGIGPVESLYEGLVDDSTEDSEPTVKLPLHRPLPERTGYALLAWGIHNRTAILRPLTGEAWWAAETQSGRSYDGWNALQILLKLESDPLVTGMSVKRTGNDDSNGVFRVVEPELSSKTAPARPDTAGMSPANAKSAISNWEAEWQAYAEATEKSHSEWEASRQAHRDARHDEEEEGKGKSIVVKSLRNVVYRAAVKYLSTATVEVKEVVRDSYGEESVVATERVALDSDEVPFVAEEVAQEAMLRVIRILVAPLVAKSPDEYKRSFQREWSRMTGEAVVATDRKGNPRKNKQGEVEILLPYPGGSPSCPAVWGWLRRIALDESQRVLRTWRQDGMGGSHSESWSEMVAEEAGYAEEALLATTEGKLEKLAIKSFLAGMEIADWFACDTFGIDPKATRGQPGHKATRNQEFLPLRSLDEKKLTRLVTSLQEKYADLVAETAQERAEKADSDLGLLNRPDRLIDSACKAQRIASRSEILSEPVARRREAEKIRSAANRAAAKARKAKEEASKVA